MPIFASTRQLSMLEIVSAWEDLFSGVSTLAVTESKAESMSFEIDGVSLCLQHMGVPVPLGDIHTACERSYMWPEAAKVLRQQKSHAILAAVPGRTREAALREAIATTRLAAAVCIATEALGLYWGKGEQVHPPELVVDMIKDTSAVPFPLWIGAHVLSAGENGPYSAITSGLDVFGHLELEVVDCSLGHDDLHDAVYDLVGYILENQATLADGETCGLNADVRWRVSHRKSELAYIDRVARVHIP